MMQKILQLEFSSYSNSILKAFTHYNHKVYKVNSYSHTQLFEVIL